MAPVTVRTTLLPLMETTPAPPLAKPLPPVKEGVALTVPEMVDGVVTKV